MKVKCINKGTTLNLTVGKEYEIVYNDDEKIHVINDNNKEARYNKSLFSTDDDIEYEFNIENLRIDDDFIIYDIDKNIKYEGLIDDLLIDDLYDLLVVDDSDISCGIKEVSGLNTFMSTIDEFVLNLINHLKELNVINIDKEVLFKKVFDLIFNNFLNSNKETCLYLIMSTNITNNPNLDLLCNSYSFDMEIELDYLSTFKHKGLNPNTGNEICLWGFKMN